MSLFTIVRELIFLFVFLGAEENIIVLEKSGPFAVGRTALASRGAILSVRPLAAGAAGSLWRTLGGSRVIRRR